MVKCMPDVPSFEVPKTFHKNVPQAEEQGVGPGDGEQRMGESKGGIKRQEAEGIPRTDQE